MKKRSVVCGIAVLLVMAFLGCNGEKRANQYFTQHGLDRLAIPRTDIKPGVLILTDGKNSYVGSNIDHFLQPSDRLNAKDNHAVTTFEAVLASLNATKGVDATAAVQIIDSIFPVNFGSTVQLKGTVAISSIDASGERIDPIDIQGLLNDSAKSRELRKVIGEYWNDDNYEIYVAYETYAAKSFSIKTTGNSVIDPSLKLNQTTTIANGQLSFKITKTSASTLDVKGNTYYVLAVKTCKLELHNGDWRLVYVPATNTGLGAMGAGDHYDVPVWPDNALSLRPVPQSR